MAKGGFILTGDKALERKLKTLGERVQRKLLRSAVNAASTPTLKAARQKAPKRTGLMRRSLGKKIVTNKKRQSVTAIIGSRKGVSGEFKGKPYRPSRVAHLTERGFINQHGTFVPPKPWLHPAMAETQGQAASVMQQKLAAGIAKEAAR